MRMWWWGGFRGRRGERLGRGRRLRDHLRGRVPAPDPGADLRAADPARGLAEPGVPRRRAGGDAHALPAGADLGAEEAAGGADRDALREQRDRPPVAEPALADRGGADRGAGEACSRRIRRSTSASGAWRRCDVPVEMPRGVWASGRPGITSNGGSREGTPSVSDTEHRSHRRPRRLFRGADATREGRHRSRGGRRWSPLLGRPRVHRERPGPLQRIVDTVVDRPEPCPLTGMVRAGEDAPERPALAVKVENTRDAYPLAGLERADVIYEEPVEGGLTRFAALFQCRDAGRVGTGAERPHDRSRRSCCRSGMSRSSPSPAPTRR